MHARIFLKYRLLNSSTLGTRLNLSPECLQLNMATARYTSSMGHKADDWISLLQCIWVKINWITGKWTLKQYYCSLAAHHMDTMLSLMSVAHQKPRGWQLPRDLLFQTRDGGDIPPKYRLDAHAFCGGSVENVSGYFGTLSDPQKRWLQYNCDQLSSLTSASKHSLLAPSLCASARVPHAQTLFM